MIAIPRPAVSALPLPIVAPLIAAALLAGLLPGGRWSDALALLASVAALCAAHEKRTGAMIVAAGLAAGLAPAGLLLAPLWLGLAIQRRAVRLLPNAAVTAALANLALPWPTPVLTLPNLAKVAAAYPDASPLIATIGIGMAAWLAARASVSTSGVLWSEARLGAILMASVLPLPVSALGIVVMLAALPQPRRPLLDAANDNVVGRRTIRLAA